MEHKDLAGLEIKADAAQGLVTAYASVFGNVDSHKDRVMPGAFTKTLMERSQRVRVLRDHDSSRVVGKPQHMEEDSTGLLTVTKMMDTPLGQETLTLLKEGAIDELSIGFMTYQDSVNDFGGRDLKELRLFEYSFLPFASNSLALVQSIKSNADLDGFLNQLDRIIAVDLRGGTLSATNLKRLKSTVTDLHALLQAKAEPSPDTPPTPEAANQDAEPQPHSDDLLTALKSFTPTIQRKSEEAAVIAELKNAFAFIHKGA